MACGAGATAGAHKRGLPLAGARSGRLGGKDSCTDLRPQTVNIPANPSHRRQGNPEQGGGDIPGTGHRPAADLGAGGGACNPEHEAPHQHLAVACGQHLGSTPEHDAPDAPGTGAVRSVVRAAAARPQHLAGREPGDDPESGPPHLPGCIQVGGVDPYVHGGRSQHHRQPPPEARTRTSHPHHHLRVSCTAAGAHRGETRVALGAPPVRPGRRRRPFTGPHAAAPTPH
ncbi:hypothetical protein ANAPC5_01218 [Anaplasma phagocytophilum]|nr:hypothetical protein ANAPC5_01218 [Anaplasma phagocytophilum]